MNKKDCISVIVPLYKGRKYIDGIIENIKDNATHINCEIEIIFVNDYPQEKIAIDKKKELIVKLVENERNKGIHASRVEGIKHSSGNYILFLDQDDKINELFLKICYETMKKNLDIPFTICNGIIEHDKYKRLIYKNKIMQLMAKKVTCYAIFDNRILSPGQCLIKREAIPDKWLKTVLKNNGADDLLLWMLILLNSNNREPMLIYSDLYTHRNTNSNTSLDLKSMYASVDDVITILQELNINRKILDIIIYRNEVQKDKRSKVEINPFFTLIIQSVIRYRNAKERDKLCK